MLNAIFVILTDLQRVNRQFTILNCSIVVQRIKLLMTITKYKEWIRYRFNQALFFFGWRKPINVDLEFPTLFWDF
jgi:hypothetical protein